MADYYRSDYNRVRHSALGLVNRFTKPDAGPSSKGSYRASYRHNLQHSQLAHHWDRDLPGSHKICNSLHRQRPLSRYFCAEFVVVVKTLLKLKSLLFANTKMPHSISAPLDLFLFRCVVRPR